MDPGGGGGGGGEPGSGGKVIAEDISVNVFPKIILKLSQEVAAPPRPGDIPFRRLRRRARV